MLQPWITFRDTYPDTPQKGRADLEAAPQETSEHRELRLRKQYEDALRLHQNDRTELAKRQFESIIQELGKSRAERRIVSSEIRHRLGAKRPRQEDVPQWERKLRFAVHRNLAEVYFQLSDYLRALQCYSSALDDDRSDFLVWVHAARSAALCGRLHVARRAFEAALTMRPGHWLCQEAYGAVLNAIGDADEDCNESRAPPSFDQSLDEAVVEIIRQRSGFEAAEKKEGGPNSAKMPDVIRLDELSWASLVDALRICLDGRLSGNSEQGLLPVAHPVAFEYSHLTKTPQIVLANSCDENSNENSDEVQLVSEFSSGVVGPAADDEMEIVAVRKAHHQGQEISSVPPDGPKNIADAVPDELIAPTAGTDEVSLVEGPAAVRDLDTEVTEGRPETGDINGVAKPSSGTVENGTEGDQRPEVRRSSRQKTQAGVSANELDRRQTRIRSGSRDSTQEDREVIRAMLELCVDDGNSRSVAQNTSPTIFSPKNNSDAGAHWVSSKVKRMSCSWANFVDEIHESAAVVQCIESFEDRNSGPADLLLCVLSRLAELKTSQYSPTLALLWSTLREKLQLHMPGSPATTALIAEALVVSGKKAGKAKARRFQEAARLLSDIRLSSLDNDENAFLRVRISWMWSQLYECQGEMQRAFLCAEETLTVLLNIKDWSKGLVPDCLGPDLSGYDFTGLKEVLTKRISSLKMGRDLEKAREELSKIGDGDTEAANRTVSILSSSVHAAVHDLQLDVWREDDLKMEFADSSELEAWEKRLDAETELEPRLAVFGEACAKSSDSVGELVCFSVRLRMGIHYYIAKLRSEIDGENEGGQNDADSSAGRLSDLLVQIRKYVAMVKKLSASSNFPLWNCNVGVSGWSLEKAAGIAALTLVSLSALLMTKIPLLKFASTTVDLVSSQKNRILGFTRCMLAFARCILLVQRCRLSTQSDSDKSIHHSSSDNPVLTRTMLYVTSLCLRALVARGCCREEGTGGALIKLYVKFLCNRLQQMASLSQCLSQNRSASKNEAKVPIGDPISSAVGCDNGQSPSARSPPTSDVSAEDNPVSKTDPCYKWNDVSVMRHELAQCYQCLYQFPELEPMSPPSDHVQDSRWLEAGCRVSKHIGVSFATGEPGAVATMDTETCKNVYLFYRNRILEGVCRRRRDGGRAKRLREALSRLSKSLPEDAPQGVGMLPFDALNKIVTEVVETRESISREAAENVSKLEAEWNRSDPRKSEGFKDSDEQRRPVQLSIVFFEVFALHSVSLLAAFDSEYKKHKTAERRKRPKEVADRLHQAATECIIALRIRPWSVGAWVLLGRIYIEIADLALDERELNLSSFGLYRPDELQSFGDGDLVETILGRAEACFGFADSLLKHSWARNACTQRLELTSAQVLGFAFDGIDEESWCGFGDDGDLFGSFGLTNETTSRPLLDFESHPMSNEAKTDTRRIAAVRFGEAAISLLRLRELRYFHSHWTHSTIEPKLPTHPRNRFPDAIIDLASLALGQLHEGQHLMGFVKDAQQSKAQELAESAPDNQNANQVSAHADHMLEWRKGFMGIERLQWYFSLVEAKLMQKVGKPPEEYFAVLHRALTENKTLRENMKQPADIEPLYRLHVSRMKILRVTEDDASAASLLTLLEKYSFRQGPIIVRVDEEKNGDKEVEDWITERKIAVAEDILSAMQFCRDTKSDNPYAEYFFKATYCRALILSEILKDTGTALQELDKLFRTEAAARVLDLGRDATHRGYFYKIWNYRITDTGIEPTLESERKLVRWRTKILGLFAQLLQQTGQWRSLAAIINRLKKRLSEDLPVDGALLDDLIKAYAVTSRVAILNSMEKSILTNAAVFEASFRRTWDIYVETLRLAQGVKRVRVSLHREDPNETGAERLVKSGRPRCLVAIHTALRLEHMRWKWANGEANVDINAMKSLPIEGSMKNVPETARAAYADTLRVSGNKWALDERMTKLLRRRISDYSVPEAQ